MRWFFGYFLVPKKTRDMRPLLDLHFSGYNLQSTGRGVPAAPVHRCYTQKWSRTLGPESLKPHEKQLWKWYSRILLCSHWVQRHNTPAAVVCALWVESQMPCRQSSSTCGQLGPGVLEETKYSENTLAYCKRKRQCLASRDVKFQPSALSVVAHINWHGRASCYCWKPLRKCWCVPQEASGLLRSLVYSDHDSNRLALLSCPRAVCH